MDKPGIGNKNTRQVGTWWHGAIAGGVVALVTLLIFMLVEGTTGADIVLLSIAFILGFLFGSAGGSLAQSKGIIASVVLGSVFGIPAVFLLLALAPVFVIFMGGM